MGSTCDIEGVKKIEGGAYTSVVRFLKLRDALTIAFVVWCALSSSSTSSECSGYLMTDKLRVDCMRCSAQGAPAQISVESPSQWHEVAVCTASSYKVTLESPSIP